MRGRDSQGDEKTEHVSVRLSPETTQYLESVARHLGYERDDGTVNRSAAIRTIIAAHNGLLFGHFWALVDPERLASEWGEVGELIAVAIQSDEPLPENIGTARLGDVVRDTAVQEGAAVVELESGGGENERTQEGEDEQR